MLKNKFGDDGECHRAVRALNNLLNLLIFHAHHVLPVYFNKLMVDEHAVASSRAIGHNKRDFPIPEDDTGLKK